MIEEDDYYYLKNASEKISNIINRIKRNSNID